MNLQKLKECRQILFLLSEKMNLEKEIESKITFCYQEILLSIVRLETSRGKCARKRIKSVKNVLESLVLKQIDQEIKTILMNCLELLK